MCMGTKQLSISNDFHRKSPVDISAADIASLAEKCPNLENLKIAYINLPKLRVWTISRANHLTLLTDLELAGARMFCDIFKGIELHMGLPNIQSIWIDVTGYDEDERRSSFLLPDMSGCERLRKVSIGENNRKDDACEENFSFPTILEEKVTHLSNSPCFLFGIGNRISFDG